MFLVKILRFLFASAVFGFLTFSATAQENGYPELKSGDKIERELKPDGKQIFRLSLKRGELFHIEVRANGIDVALAIATADGSILLKQADDSHDQRGTENLYYMPESEMQILLAVFGLKAADATNSGYVLEVNPTLSDERKRNVAKLVHEAGDEYCYKDKNYATAVLFHEYALKLWRELKDLNNAGNDLTSVGNDYLALNEFAKAQSYYEQALAIDRELQNKRGEAYDLRDIGRAYYFQKKLKLAIDYHEKAAAAAREIKDFVVLADILSQLGSFYFTNSQFEESLAVYDELAKLADDSKDAQKQMEAAAGVGNALMELGQYEKALERAETAVKLSVELKDRLNEAYNLMGVGLVYIEIGQYDKTIEYYEKAQKINVELKDKSLENSLILNTGVVYYRVGAYDKANDAFAKSLKLSEELKDDQNTAIAIADLGNTATRLKQYDKALGYFDKVLPLLDNLKADHLLVVTKYYYGNIMREKGNFERAVRLHEESAALAHSIKIKKYEARALYELGMDYLAQKQPDLATLNFQQALLVAHGVGVPDNEARALDGLMQAWAMRKQPAIAIFYGKQAINFHQATRRDISKFEKAVQQDYVKDNELTYRNLADLLISQGRFQEAQSVLAMLKEEEFAGFLSHDAKEIETLSKRADLNAEERAALEKYDSVADNLTKIGAELADLQKKKNKTAEGEPFPEQARFNELSAQVEAANNAFQIFIQKQLAAEIGKSKTEEIGVDQALQGKLAQWGNGTVALSTVLGEERYRVILTTAKTQTDGKTEYKDVKSASGGKMEKLGDLNAKIFEFRAALRNPSIDPRPLGKELYDILIKPIEKDLAGANAKTLLWSLDGSLRYVPIGALWDGKQYLAQKYQNVILTSTTRQSLTAQIDRDWRGFGAGVTKESSVKDADGSTVSFEGLPSVAGELSSIIKNTAAETGVMSGKRFLDVDFTVDSLKNSLGKRDDEDKLKYNVIHLATHFKLGGDSASSFLLLGDGQALTLQKVATTPEIDFTDVELVTLSACNTAFGTATNKECTDKTQCTGKEVDSLAQFIENRGAKAVMATLWSVADESTQLLMAEFYRLKKENPKMTKAEALQTAQIEMISGKLRPSSADSQKHAAEASKRRGDDLGDEIPFQFDSVKAFAHPYFWSPFVLIGNWR